MARLTFLGAARTVTGSQYLVEAGGRLVLVDSGMFQGDKALRQRNWSEPGFPAAKVDAIVLTHTHLDHIGRVPRLVKLGFRGEVYCTPPTQELAEILLLDAAHLQLEDAEYLNRKGLTKHQPALPLFDDSRRAGGDEAVPARAARPHAGRERLLLLQLPRGRAPAGGGLRGRGAPRERACDAGPVQRRRGPLRRGADQGPRARARRRLSRDREHLRQPHAPRAAGARPARGRAEEDLRARRGAADPRLRGRARAADDLADGPDRERGPHARVPDPRRQPDGDRRDAHLRPVPRRDTATT